jgi:hypothetical protein
LKVYKNTYVKKEGFSIHYDQSDARVVPEYIGKELFYRVCLKGGDKLLQLEEKEGKKLHWIIRGEGQTEQAQVLGQLIEAKTMK